MNEVLSPDRGLYLLEDRHAPAMQQLLSDYAVTQWTRIPYPYPEGAALAFVREQVEKRQQGQSYSFAIEQRGLLVGVCTLMDVNERRGELGYWIGRAFWGQGLATFGVKWMLEFAFQNLKLDVVQAHALEANAPSRRVLEKSNFRYLGIARCHDCAMNRPDEPVVAFEQTRAEWSTARHANDLTALHPALRALVDAELAMGNEIRESSQGWPESGSVVIRLRAPFRSDLQHLPAAVALSNINDP
ncbi:MAG TPA: GNAT family N-acetyltransferase, partial [Pirellulaceae bacterium]|nr:GNAT family N-acetyltransferase [Pirellulaceae bacterium]